MDEIKRYETRFLNANVTDDGEWAVVTFTPLGDLPVSIQVQRAVLERFLAQARAALDDQVPRDKA